MMVSKFGISFSRGLFSGGILGFRGVITLERGITQAGRFGSSSIPLLNFPASAVEWRRARGVIGLGTMIVFFPTSWKARKLDDENDDNNDDDDDDDHNSNDDDDDHNNNNNNNNKKKKNKNNKNNWSTFCVPAISIKNLSLTESKLLIGIFTGPRFSNMFVDHTSIRCIGYPTLPETNSSSLKIGLPKRKGSSSNQQVSGANC